MQFRKKRVRRTDKVMDVLLSIYGIGNKQAVRLCKATGVIPNASMELLSDEQLTNLTNEVELTCPYGLALRTQLLDANRKKGRIKLQRWVRQMDGLPSRGQRTQSNAATARLMNRRRRIKNK